MLLEKAENAACALVSALLLLLEDEPNREESHPLPDDGDVPAPVPPETEVGTTPLPKSTEDERAEGPNGGGAPPVPGPVPVVDESFPRAQRYLLNGPHFSAFFSEAEGANGDGSKLSESFDVVPIGCMNPEKATFSADEVPENHLREPGSAGRPGTA